MYTKYFSTSIRLQSVLQPPLQHSEHSIIKTG